MNQPRPLCPGYKVRKKSGNKLPAQNRTNKWEKIERDDGSAMSADLKIAIYEISRYYIISDIKY